MNGNSGWNKLNDAMRTFQDAWDRTEAGWRDQKRVEFEDDCIQPIASSVDRALRAMKELSEVLARAYRECRDDAE